MNGLALTIALLLMLIGLAGTILPLLPGATLIILGMIAYGMIAGFASFNLFFWLGQFALLGAVFSMDYLAGAIGSKFYGGSKGAIWGSIAGALVGLLFGPLGIIFGPLLGATLGEIALGNSLPNAIKAGFGTILGLAGGILAKFILETAMIVWFLWVIF